MPRVNELTPAQRKRAKTRRQRERRYDCAFRSSVRNDLTVFQEREVKQDRPARVDRLTTPHSEGYKAAAAYLNKST
ncbi:hypothetical protein [Pseudomonas phage PJNP013]|uniref:Transcriptional regulator n=1 Tax=Pseudomonas phage PJNP013 TaxID=3108093 RepID=A0ABZ2CUC3_9CAUD